MGGPPRLQCRPYLLDLESTNGTFINGIRLDAAKYYQLKKGDVIKFDASSREYIILTENTTSITQKINYNNHYLFHEKTKKFITSIDKVVTFIDER